MWGNHHDFPFAVASSRFRAKPCAQGKNSFRFSFLGHLNTLFLHLVLSFLFFLIVISFVLLYVYIWLHLFQIFGGNRKSKNNKSWSTCQSHKSCFKCYEMITIPSWTNAQRSLRGQEHYTTFIWCRSDVAD